MESSIADFLLWLYACELQPRSWEEDDIKFDLSVAQVVSDEENKKKPTVTIPNLKARAAKGDAFWTIISPDMKAEDHNSINSKGKVFIIY